MRKEMDSMTTGAAAFLDALGVSYTWSGVCLWLGDEARAYGSELVALGFHWSGKRSAWYWRAAA